MNNGKECALDHAWRYFALHAEQRTTVFNFFAAAAGLTLSGLVAATSSKPGELGLVAGLGAMLLALVFWKLDQRVAQLTKCAEQVLVEIERQIFTSEQQTLVRSENLPVNISVLPFSGTWSYGRAFRILFAGVAAAGLIGAAINSYRIISRFNDEHGAEATAEQQPANRQPPHPVR